MKMQDLTVLSALFAPNADVCVVVSHKQYDFVPQNVLLCENINELNKLIKDVPQKKVLVCIDQLYPILTNNLTIVLQLEPVKWLLNFNSNAQQIIQKYPKESYHYTNNPDATMRWIYPTTNSHPLFLSLYNSDSAKAVLYKWLIRWTFKLGLEGFVCSGKFDFYYKEAHPINTAATITDVFDYAVFTGTVGQNRKVLLAIGEKEEVYYFFKYPINAASKALVHNEAKILQKIELLIDKRRLVFPTVSIENKGILLSNIKPQKIKNKNFGEQHLLALKAMYAPTATQTTWLKLKDKMPFNKQIIELKQNSTPVNSLSTQKINALLKHIAVLEEQLQNTNIPINTALAHLDFTPWNMYLDANKVYLYDWELARFDMPLLFDAFHYVFQQHILVKKSDFKTIEAAITDIKSSPITQKIIQQYNVNFLWAYRFYLWYTVSYYLPLYAKQKHLHEQAYWLIDTWLQACETVNQ